MKFTSEEKTRLLNYISKELMKENNLSLEEATKIVYNSILPEKIDSCSSYIGHCNMNQLIKIVLRTQKEICASV
jgi:hypothetical protein